MSEPLKVYRVQDKHGRGPWRPGFAKKWLDEDKPGWEKLVPWPMQFGLGILQQRLTGQECGCACESIEQLRLWFSPTEWKKLLGFGYKCVELDVSRVLAKSDVQLVFVRNLPLRGGGKEIELYPKEVIKA